MNTTEFKKLKTALRAKLEGLAMADPKYYRCVKAFDFAIKIHTKTRKDGVTPEVYHQLNMLAFALNFHNMLIEPDKVYVCILLHDAYEDYKEWIDKLEAAFPEDMVYIKRISKIVYHKNPDGSYTAVEKNKKDYMDDMANCPITSVGKGIDRIHNLSTMKGVFKIEKQIAYCKEAKDYFLPMLKEARRKFVHQSAVYEALKSVMNLVISPIEHFIDNLTGERDDYKECITKPVKKKS